MEFDNVLEKEFQVKFPDSLNERIKLSLKENKPFVFECYNFQEFLLLGSQLIAGNEAFKTVNELKVLDSNYPMLKGYVPIAYTSVDYFTNVLCLKATDGVCDNELYFFCGLEGNPFFFVDMKIPISEVLEGDVDLERDVENIRHNSCKEIHDYHERFFDKFIVVSGYGSHIEYVINELNELLETDGKFVVDHNRIFFKDKLIYEYPSRVDEFIPNEFFKIIEDMFPEYCWFQTFIYWDLEHWGFGKFLKPDAKDELMRKGFRKFEVRSS